MMEKKLHLSKLPGLPPPGLGASAGTRKGLGVRKRDYSALPWSDYFDSRKNVESHNSIFTVYEKGHSGPVIFCLHGGGYSALTWAPFAKEISRMCTCRVVAVDLRAHGDTRTPDDDDLSATTMANDVTAVLAALYYEEFPPIVLMGHSMGGAIAIHTAANASSIPSLSAMVVLDVVEGSALEALAGMQTVLRSRPKTFKSLEYAIEWCVRSGQTRNSESARVSMPGQVRVATDTDLRALGGQVSMASATETIAEDSADNTNETAPSSFVWRTDLRRTEKHWRGWFEGLSSTFLSCSVPKLLLLAGIDRLDKDLSIGQMQGKFQMQVLREVGHAVHEDAPDKVAQVIATFLIRHQLCQPLEGFRRVAPIC